MGGTTLSHRRRRGWTTRMLLCILGGVAAPLSAAAQAPPPFPLQVSSDAPTAPLAPPALEDGDRPLPIDLAAALKLANAQAVDVAPAAERVHAAAALLDQAEALWLPTVTLGGDYNRHD